MPASLCDGSLESERALQLAIELQHLMSMGDSNSGMPEELSTFAFFQANMDDVRNKKSQNMTECVPVPSSEHVAEIVGRQGCKIKALRAKTNTYIKTPVRGEEPVFVVTGRKEDVAKAKREILSAAEHFSQIRASRKSGLMGMSPPGPPIKQPGQITIQVRVPYRVVGLVVGPKGATIKRIQQTTHTYIVTPSRDKEPVFEVTGMADQVEAAREEIEAHIAVRTGSVGGTNIADLFPQPSLLEESPDLLSAIYKTGLESLLNILEPHQGNPGNDPLGMLSSASASSSSGAFSSSGSISSSSSSSGGRLADMGSIWSSSLDRDEGIGESPGLTGDIWSFPSTRPSPTASASPTESISKRECLNCVISEANAALVPCGHALFCYECASRLREGQSPVCPICNTLVGQVLRIFAS